MAMTDVDAIVEESVAGTTIVRTFDRTFRLAALKPMPALGRAQHERAVRALEERLRLIQLAYAREERSGIVVFQGWDASGKGGTIRRMTSRLDPRACLVWPIGAPEPAEAGRHYLYRFAIRLPDTGQLAVFDRSWYGRVLVERVEELVPRAIWRRAYREINGLERALTDDRTRVVKIFLHISAAEQLRRFKKRAEHPLNRWKLTAEDFRNRAKWPAYEAAVDEMVARTSRPAAPWTVVYSNDKKRARVAALGAIAAQLGEGIDLAIPPLDPAVARLLKKALAG